MVFHLIRSPQNISRELGEASANLKTELKLCENCKNITTSNLCGICEDSTRDISKVCVMEEALDVLAFEKAGVWKGVYHVLHGVLNPLDGIGPESLTISDLVSRVEKGGVEEIILAMNPSLEGEATAMYLTKQLQNFPQVKITRIARGLPTCSELSYADEVTLQAAMTGRREF